MENYSGMMADISAVTRPNYMGMGCGGFGMGGDWILGLIVLAALFNGGGFGGFGGGGGLQSAVFGAQQFGQLDNGIRAVQNGICDSTFALNNSIKDGFYSTTYELAGKIDQVGYAQKDCCCQTQRAIDSVKFENSQNTCQIINAIHAEGEQTRAQMTQNTIQALRDKLADKDRDVLARDFQLSQLAQNSYLVNTLNPTPKPAYVVANPNCCQSPCAYNYGAFA